MADPGKFAENFAFLKKNGVIPEVAERHLSDQIKEVIGGLTETEMKVLVDICSKTKSYLYLHESPNGVVMTGL